MPTEEEYKRKFFRENPEMVEKLKAMKDRGIVSDASDIADNDAPFIVGGPDPRGMIGSKQMRCSCGTVVWISPSSQKIIERVREYKISCMACAMAMVETTGKPKH